MDAEILAWIQSWYLSQCDGDWEHRHGIEITTLDNPGWRVEIDLAETALVSENFCSIGKPSPLNDIEVNPHPPFGDFNRDNGEYDWVTCRVLDEKFIGHGDPTKLIEILNSFKDWASLNWQTGQR